MHVLQHTLFELLSYGYLEDDWDGEGSSRPSKQLLSKAWKLIGLFIENEIPIRSIMISGTEGEISFYWRLKGYVEVAVDGSDAYTFDFLIDDKKEPIGEDDILFEDFRKSKIYEYFKTNKFFEKKTEHEIYYYNLISKHHIIQDI